MKTNLSKALRRLGLPALAFAAFLASCTSELEHEPAPGGGSGQAGEAEVTLRLQVPGATTAGKTRGITAEAENRVEDLYILAFKVDDAGNETFDYHTVARKGTENPTAGQSEWTASLRPKDYNQTFVMVANALGTNSKVNEQIVNLAANSVGENKMTVLEQLTEALNADEQAKGYAYATHPFTMYGQTTATRIELGKDVTLTVALHRIVARVQVKFEGDALANFTASKVYLFNYTDRARVIPNNLEETADNQWEQAVTVPADAEKYPKAFDDLGNIPTYTVAADGVKNEIYLFETFQPAADDADGHLKRPCLVVQGTYEGYEGYYRVDFATQDAATGDVTYRDIIRNHSYNITVTNVSGRGSATLQEAMNEKASNLTADMILWNDNVIGNIDFEGDRVLGISTNSYELIKSGGIRLLQVRATKNVTWTANIYAAKPDGSADTQGTRPAWISFTDADGNPQVNPHTTDPTKGIDALQNVYFKATVNEGTDAAAERKAVIRLTDEKNRLSVEALVTQNQVSVPVTLSLMNGNDPVNEIEFMQNDGTATVVPTVKFGPDDVVLSWEITVDDGDKGIKMKSLEVNGTPHADLANMKGDINATTGADETSVVIEPAAEGFTIPEPYGTRRGRLMLVATRPSTGETRVLDIPMYQKKYGLVIDKTEVLCGGQEVLIYVKGNMPWNVSIAADDPGYMNAWNENLIFQFDNTQWGDPSETAWVKESVVRIKTQPTPTLKKNADPDYYKAKLAFKNRDSKAPIDPIEIDFKPGILAVDKWVDYNKVTNIYEVHGPVQRSVNTKTNGYTEDATVTGAAIMDFEQASALTRATEGKADWGICKESVMTHELVVHSQGLDSYTGPYSKNFAVATLATNTGGYIAERKGITHAQASGYKELERQVLLSLYYQATGDRHEYFWVTGTKKNNNVEYNIEKIGYMTEDKYGNLTIFNTVRYNPTWVHKSGDWGHNIPIMMYGGAMETYLKPNFSFSGSNWAQENYQIRVSRPGTTDPYDITPDKDIEYPTYYFKHLETE